MKVLITREIPQAGIEILKKYPQLELVYKENLAPLTPQELEQAAKGVDAIIPVIPDQVTKKVLQAAGPNLKIVAAYSVGYDNIDIETAKSMGIYVANTPGDLTESVAEHSLALMMALGRHLIASDKFVRDGKYRYWDPMIFLGPKFMGKTLGIIGFGRIGQYFAGICKKGLNMNILYVDEIRKEDKEKELGAELVDMDTLLDKSDVVSIHCNLCEKTIHMIGDKELRKMKPTAYLINTARGQIINEEALCVALRENWIEGAALDVFEDEPKVNPELLSLDNVILTPHIASATREARIQMARMAAANVVEVLINGKPPMNRVV